MDLEVCLEAGLAGLVPWFTCERGLQSLAIMRKALQDHVTKISAPPKKNLRALGLTAYCDDWFYPSTGNRTGGYDTVSTTAEECMSRCVQLSPASTRFYLRGNNCGCCSKTSDEPWVNRTNYTAYQIESEAPACPWIAPKGKCVDPLPDSCYEPHAMDPAVHRRRRCEKKCDVVAV